MYLCIKIILVVSFINLCFGNNGLKQPERSLVIVFDVTSSMTQEIEGLSKGVQVLLDDFVSRQDQNPVDNYIFVQFRDEEFEPDLLPVFISKNYNEVKAQLQTLGIRDGANSDCAESSYSALKRGLEVANHNSIFFVVTDAATKNPELLPDILKLISRKRCQLYFFISLGGCIDDDYGLEVAEDYRDLAKKSNGMLFEVEPEQIDHIFPVFSEMLSTNTSLQSMIVGSAGKSSYDVTVDKSMNEFTFTITAEKPVIKLYDPKSNLLPESQWQKLLDMSNIKIFKIRDPESGIWKMEIESEYDFTGQISTKSELQFKYGFSVSEPSSISETDRYPLKGHKTFLAIHPSNSLYINDLDFILLVLDSGISLKYILRKKQTPNGDIFLTVPFEVPTESFKVVLHGKDPTNHIIERLLSPTIVAYNAGKPAATVVSNIRVNESESVYLICGVISAINVTISWSKVGHNTQLKSLSSVQSKILNYTIEKADISDAGEYVCAAENSEGRDEFKTIVEIVPLDLSVSTEQNVVTTQAGDKIVELKCVVKPNMSSVSTSWLFNGTSDLPKGSILNVTNLVLYDIKPNFSGNYTCLGKKNSFEKRANIQLDVQYPPKIINILNSSTNIPIDETKLIEIYDKTQLNIICLHEGNPVPDIKWVRHTGQTVSKTADLSINGSDLSQSGDYSCQIETTLGFDTQNITVDIAIIPKRLAAFDRVHKIKLGDSFKLECPIEPILHNKVAFSWFHNGTFSNQTKFLEWPAVNHNANGKYKCIAENKAGSVEATIHLNITYEPRILKLTKSTDFEIDDLDLSVNEVLVYNTTKIDLSCTANGNPEPKISWIKAGNVISIGHRLTITDTVFGFSGSIECSAQNELNTANRIITLNEIERPAIEHFYQNYYNLTENESFTVKCPIKSKSEYQVTWTLNGKSIDNFKQVDGSLNIISVPPTGMKGNVSCVAINKAGAVQANLVFDVLRAPYNLTRTTDNKISLMANETLNMTCSALGNPKPHIYWIKGNQHLLNGNSVAFISLEPTDAANYTCIATNTLGNCSTTFELIVNSPPHVIATPDSMRISRNANITILKLDNVSNDDQYPQGNYKRIVQFNVGDNISLHCPIKGHPTPTIKWFKNNNIYGSNKEAIHFDNIATFDSGIYQCLGSNAYGDLASVFFLTAQSQFIDAAKPIEIFDHSVHQFVCAYEELTIKIEWIYHNGTVKSNSSLLIINGRDPLQSGDYHCQIQSDSGFKNQSIHVNVILQNKPLDSFEKTLEVSLGSPVILECPFKQIPNNKWTISWYHNGTLIHHNSILDNKYRLPSATHSDNGIYKCRVDNKAGPLEIELNVNVVYEPSILSLEKIDDNGKHLLAPNQNLIEIYNTSMFGLICHVNGNPEPITVWKRNHVELSTTPELNLKILNSTSSGTYQCIAENKLNSADRSVNIKVIESPIILPHFSKLVNLTENMSYSMACPMEPGEFNVEWYLNGKSIDSVMQPNGEIKFSVVTPKLVGDVSCIATNKAGSAKATLRFDVSRAPYNISITSHLNKIENISDNLYNITLHESESLDVACSANGNPTPIIIWIKDNQLYSTGNLITINSVTFDDRGNYTCSAKNDLGIQIQVFEVAIWSGPQLLSTTNLAANHSIASIIRLRNNINVAEDYFGADFKRKRGFNVGDNITLNCQMRGNPVPQISWSKDNKPIDETKQIFRKVRGSTADAGIYKCKGTNTFGSIQVLFYVYEADKVVDYTRSIEVYDNVAQHFLCAYNGDETLINWSDQYGTVVSKTPMLTINGSGILQSAEFYCQIGLRKQILSVSITNKPELDLPFQKEHKIKLGHSFDLYCPILAIPGNKLELKWYRNNIDLNKHFDRNAPLRFAKVEHGDAGIYKCTAQNKAGYIEAEIKLEVVYPPSIIKIGQINDFGFSTLNLTEQIIEIYNTSIFQLICYANGNPTPAIVWKKDGVFFSPSDTLDLDVASEFSGDYQCFAENFLNAAVLSIQLKQIKRPKALSSYSTIKELVLNTKFTMPCPIENGDYNVTWTFNGRSFDRFKQPNQSIFIDSVSSNMKGDVRCIATNKAGSDWASFEFEIFRPPFNIHATSKNPNRSPFWNEFQVNENDQYDLTCTADGNPEPFLRWEKNGNYYSIGERLDFSSIQYHDGGEYSCIATNVYGTINSTYSIIVKNTSIPLKMEVNNLQKASNINEARFLGITVLSHLRISDDYFEADYHTNITAKETETFILNCTTSGHPAPRIKWFKNNKPLNTENEPIAIFKNATIRDCGIYKCFASNRHSHLQVLFYVIVSQPISIRTITSSKLVYQEDETISIKCKVKGNPMPVMMLKSRTGLSTTTENVIKQSIKRENYFQLQNGTFYTNYRKKVIDAETIKQESEYNIITFGFDNDGEYVGTLNHIKKSATIEHTSNYTCFVFKYGSPTTDRSSKNIWIPIEKAPYIDTTTTKEVYYIPKTSKNFPINCPIKGSPTPIVEWFYGINKITKKEPFKPNGNQLKVTQPTMANTGSYSCKHVDSSLEVKFKIQIIQNTFNLNDINLSRSADVIIEKGKTKQLNCSYGGLDIFWNEIRDDGSNRVASLLANLQTFDIVGDLSRTIMCTNQVDPQYGQIFNIIVHEKPAFSSNRDTVGIKVDANLRLICDFKYGNPTPMIKWYKNIKGQWEDSQNISGFQVNGPALTKPRTQLSDDSEYKCVAENKLGANEKYFTVTGLNESHYFGDWGAWTKCSRTCGIGIRQRSRLCVHISCNFVTHTDEQRCNVFNCPIDGGWSKWSKSSCSKTCLRYTNEISVITATRQCNNPEPAFGGKPCRGFSYDSFTCKVPMCNKSINKFTYTDCTSPYKHECCPDGYQFNNKTLTCEEIEPCARRGPNSVCNIKKQQCVSISNDTGKFRCDCKPGFERKSKKSKKCHDINECETNLDNCGNKRCFNTQGSFKCL